MTWESTNNIARLPLGSKRSVDGYAAESLVIGRALLCGYNLFFKAWRDSPYDAVLDYGGELYRVEIKGTVGGTTMSATSGARSGAQIDTAAESREHILTKEDCDFLIGVNSSQGDCYIVPTEVLQIINKKAPTLNALNRFKEKWAIFMGFETLVLSDIREGISKKPLQELADLGADLKVDTTAWTAGQIYPWIGTQSGLSGLTEEQYLILDIWAHVYDNI